MSNSVLKGPLWAWLLSAALVAAGVYTDVSLLSIVGVLGIFGLLMLSVLRDPYDDGPF